MSPCKQQQHGPVPSWCHTITVLVGHAWMVLQLRNCYSLTKSPASLPKQLCRAGMLLMPVCCCLEVCKGPLPPLWAGSWPGCAAGPIGLGTALSVPVSVLVQGHTRFGFLRSLGPDLRFPLFLKAPVSLCTPILCWLGDPLPPLSPGASLMAAQEGKDILGRLMRSGRAGTCRFPRHSAPSSFALSVGTGALPTLRAPNFGVSACPLQDPALMVPTWP